MQIVVINLDRSPDRLAHMTAALAALGLPFERVAGVDGRELSADELRAYTETHRRSAAWFPGEIGNALSHIGVWRRIAAGPPGWTLVLEDDISLSQLLPEFLQHFQRADIPPNALVKLETMGSSIVVSRRPLFDLGPVGLHVLRTPHMGSAGYLVERGMAATLAANHTIVDDPIDGIWKPWLAKQIGARLLQAVPALVVQDDFDRRGKTLGLPSLINSEGTGRARETKLAKIKRTIRDFPRRGIVIGRRQRIPFAG